MLQIRLVVSAAHFPDFTKIILIGQEMCKISVDLSILLICSYLPHFFSDKDDLRQICKLFCASNQPYMCHVLTFHFCHTKSPLTVTNSYATHLCLHHVMICLESHDWDVSQLMSFGLNPLGALCTIGRLQCLHSQSSILSLLMDDLFTYCMFKSYHSQV